MFLKKNTENCFFEEFNPIPQRQPGAGVGVPCSWGLNERDMVQLSKQSKPARAIE